MAENPFEIIKRELSETSPQHGNMLARIVQDLAPEQLQNLQHKAAEGQMALELEALRKVHQFQASSADIDQFIEHVKTLELTMKNRFSTYKAEGTFQTATGTTTIQTKKQCYVATAVYGDAQHADVIFLQSFRDNHLERTMVGRCFIRTYYKVGPFLAPVTLSCGLFARIVRGLLATACRYGRRFQR